MTSEEQFNVRLQALNNNRAKKTPQYDSVPCDISQKAIKSPEHCFTIEWEPGKNLLVHKDIDDISGSIIIFPDENTFSIVSKNKHRFTLSNYYWIASLSNGLTIFEDDLACFPMAKWENSWFRLQKYCNFTGAKITGFRFRANGLTHTFDLKSTNGLFIAIKHGGDVGAQSKDLAKLVGVIRGNIIDISIYDFLTKTIRKEERELSGNEAFCFMFGGK